MQIIWFLIVGVVVEIDETHVHTCKYNRGRRGPQNWIFGGIERQSKKVFLVNLNYEPRTAVILQAEIRKYIRPGSIIYSDSHRSYTGINSMGLNYTHRAVNHSVEFVTGDDGEIHTQTIERLWGDLKEWVIKRGRTPKHLPYYLARYEFVRRHGSDAERFHNLWLLLANLYKPELPQ